MSAVVPDPHTLALFAVASIVMLAVPGPSVLYIVTRSVTQGRAAGLVSMLGIETGALVHVAAAALGLSALLASSAEAYTVVRYAGAAYLVYLGVRTWRSRAPAAALHVERRTHARLFWEGALVNVLNPKTALFFLAFLPQFVDPRGGPVAVQVAVLGALFVTLAVLSDGLYAVAAGSVGGWLRSRREARRHVSSPDLPRKLRRRLARMPCLDGEHGILQRAGAAVYVALGATAALTGERPRGAR